MTTTIVPASTGRRRGVELALLVLATAMAVGAFASVELAHSSELPANLGSYAAGLLAVFLVAHVGIRWLAPYADPLLLPCVALLNGLGLVLIHRLDLAAAARAARAGAERMPRADAPIQLGWTALGVVCFVGVLVLVRDHRVLARYTYTALAAGFGLLCLPLLPGLGRTINGSRIWIRFAGFSFQPAELAKIVLIVFFAGYLVAKRDVLALAGRRVLLVDLPRGRDLGPILLAWLVSLLVLVFERDLGTSLLFFGVFVTLLYVATERVSWLIIGLLLFVAGATLAYHLFGHVRVRVDVWLHPFDHAATTGYQIVQSLYGLATGGILGTGLGQGHPEFVPFANTDFIVSTIGEELGYTGLLAILVIYAIVVQRAFRTAIAARDPFGKLLAAGLGFALAIQLFVVVGGVTRLIPLTGLTTPFLSYGGSSLVANWIIVALLLRISDASRRPAPPPAPTGTEQTVLIPR